MASRNSDSSDLSQDTRIGKFNGKIDGEELMLLRVDGMDAVNELFEITVEVLSAKPSLDLDDGIGKSFTIELNTHAHGKKYYNGILTEAGWLGTYNDGQIYQLVLRPGLWLATRRRNQRIFNDQKATDILAAIFSEHGLEHRIDVTGVTNTLEYTVQFGETDYDFARRLMARFGISFHFQGDDGKHTLVLTNDHNGFESVEGTKRLVVLSDRQHVSTQEHFSAFTSQRRLTTGRVALTDYNFKTSKASMEAEQEGDAKYEKAKLEGYDYPGNYEDQGAGKTVAKVRMIQERSEDKRFQARGDLMSLSAGQKVTTKDHPEKSLNKEYLTLRSQFQFTAEDYASGGGNTGAAYEGSYEFVETAVPFGPPMIETARKMAGIQTGVVSGDGDIDCDEYGRILVKFHWEREGSDSMRCRVAQSWAGSNWGSMFIPRVGMEVVVQFVDGDPDRPLVTGCVYNDANMPPYDLPGEKNLGGVKSNSVDGSGYNEYVFDDTSGAELIRQHAQMDMETEILNDERRTVGENRTTDIGTDETLTVGGKRDTTIDGNDTLTVGAELKITATTAIKLICGGSSITMTPGSIKIESIAVDVTASGQLTTTAGGIATHSASGIMTITGALVKINS